MPCSEVTEDCAEIASVFPVRWQVERLRFSILSNPVRSEVADWEKEALVSFVPMDAVGEFGGIDATLEKSIGDIYAGYTYFAEGDILVAKITPCFENGKGAIAEGLINGVGFGTTEFHVVRPLGNLSARWLFYLTISERFRKVGASEMLGAGGQKRIPEDFIKDFRTGIPPLPEQQQIATFLDWKTGQLDALIAKQRELIEKLKENRQAIITQAVTKGLNAEAPLRDSGIAWLGAVPTHWGVKRARFSVRVNPPTRRLRLLDAKEEVSFVPMDSVEVYGGLDLEQTRTIEETTGGYTEFQNGDVVLAKITPCFENGKTALAKDLVNGVAFGTTELHVLRAESVLDERFLFYITISHAFRNLGESEMYGAGGQKRVPPGFIKDFRFGLPTMSEQFAIADRLDQITDKIDRMIGAAQLAVTVLTEYRSALITAATTGKIDVRQIAVPAEV